MQHHIIRAANQLIIMKYPIFFSSPRGRPRRAPMKRPARAGDGRAEHPFASASTLPMHEFMPDPHGLRCAVQAGCNSCLVSRGDAPVGPVGPDAPPSPSAPSSPTGGLGCAASFFFLVPKPSNSCNQIFKSHENVDRDSLVLTSRPRQIWEGEAIRSSRCSATAPC